MRLTGRAPQRTVATGWCARRRCVGCRLRPSSKRSRVPPVRDRSIRDGLRGTSRPCASIKASVAVRQKVAGRLRSIRPPARIAPPPARVSPQSAGQLARLPDPATVEGRRRRVRVQSARTVPVHCRSRRAARVARVPTVPTVQHQTTGTRIRDRPEADGIGDRAQGRQACDALRRPPRPGQDRHNGGPPRSNTGAAAQNGVCRPASTFTVNGAACVPMRPGFPASMISSEPVMGTGFSSAID